MVGNIKIPRQNGGPQSASLFNFFALRHIHCQSPLSPCMICQYVNLCKHYLWLKGCQARLVDIPLNTHGHMRPYSQRFCNVGHSSKYTLKCDVTKSLRIGLMDAYHK